jgi:hypothetical protein
MSPTRADRQPSGKRKQQARRPKKQSSIPEVTWLFEDAPIGTYLVDSVAEELFAAGAKGNSAIEFVKTLRHEISLAARLAAVTAENHFVNEPRWRHLTKRLFSDLKKVQKLIDRNANLNRETIFLSTKRMYGGHPLPPPDQPDEIDNLLAAMQRTRDLIKDFLSTRKLQGHPGNYDPLTRGFIYEVFEVWQQVLWVEGSAGEGRLFLRLLVAAWRDFDFPTRERDGQRLEDWLTDRMRKQFSEGICSTRLRFQDEGMYRAWLGLDLD